ncbi:hypothetical protein EC957_005727 [Mortierella hygrophila]|uniref:Histone chaperone domain-containing protein n=1 Tax=Mortierella hygrophila TaxID=979708 RepID=A0A9P6JZE1_9FUNG|nr:hypothetical protein EC957_005727 [Mortierella hygrophila]
MSDNSAERSEGAAGKRKADEPIAPEATKRSVGSSSSAKPEDLEDDSEQEDDDLDEDLDFLETSNIIHTGRRTRGVKIDYSKVSQEDLDDDEEDDEGEDAVVAPDAVDDDEEDDEDDDEEEEDAVERAEAQKGASASSGAAVAGSSSSSSGSGSGSPASGAADTEAV